MNLPDMELPYDHEAVEIDGKVVIRKRAEHLLSRTISFRLPTGDLNQLTPFFETFHPASQTGAFRWLINQPEVKALIQRRIESVLEDAR